MIEIKNDLKLEVGDKSGVIKMKPIDESKIMTLGVDGQIKVWDLNEMKEVIIFEN